MKESLLSGQEERGGCIAEGDMQLQIVRAQGFVFD